MNRNALRTAVGAMLAVTVAVGLLANCGAPSSQAPTLPAPTVWLTETPGVEPTRWLTETPSVTATLLATAAPRPSPTATALATPHPITQATGGQNPTPTPPPVEIDAEDTRPPTPEPPPYAGVPATVGKGVIVYQSMWADDAGKKLTLPENAQVQVLYTDSNEYDSIHDWYLISYTDTDGKTRVGYIPKNRIRNVTSVKPITAAQSNLTKQAELRALPAPRPGHQIADDQGHTINLLGEAWTPQEINLLKTRLEWIKANDPVLYAKLFAGFSVIEKGTQNTVLKDVGVCTGEACTGIAKDGSIAMVAPDVERFLNWGDTLSSSLSFHDMLWHEFARRYYLTNDPSYRDFQGIPKSNAEKFNQLASALGWLAIDKMEKRYGVTSDSIKLKNYQLRYVGLPDGTDLSHLINDPGIRASGILGQ
ncbi:MAG: hypothetical protein K1X65_13180 [Caldilineales bacterium]|nr:hypothetical protein [Caldilineales bacterium]